MKLEVEFNQFYEVIKENPNFIDLALLETNPFKDGGKMPFVLPIAALFKFRQPETLIFQNVLFIVKFADE